MKRIFFQYLAMSASLALMFSATAYLRGSADTSYTLQLATFLILLSWSSPFEASIGNLIFKSFDSVPAAERAVISRRDFMIFYRIMLVGFGFAIAFAFYPNGSLTPGSGIPTLIGLLFVVRLIEYCCRINLILLGYGLWGQIILNSFTALKWLVSIIVFMMGFKEFTYLLIGHIVLGIASSIFLIRKRLQQVISTTIEQVTAIPAMRVRDDLFSVISVGLGVFSFQLDKLAIGASFVSADFAQYVLLCTLVFIGPYLLSPVFSLFQQHLASIHVEDEIMNDFHSSVIRSSALIVTVFSMPLLIFINFVWPVKATNFAHSQAGIIALASYLNCLAHIYYLRYQVSGRVGMIFGQNLTSAITALMTLAVLTVLQSHLYSVILLVAALGQYTFGVVMEAMKSNYRRIWLHFTGLIVLVPYLLLKFWNTPLNMLIAVFLFLSIGMSLIAGIFLEARVSGVDIKSYFRLFHKFVQYGH